MSEHENSPSNEVVEEQLEDLWILARGAELDLLDNIESEWDYV